MSDGDGGGAGWERGRDVGGVGKGEGEKGGAGVIFFIYATGHIG